MNARHVSQGKIRRRVAGLAMMVLLAIAGTGRGDADPPGEIERVVGELGAIVVRCEDFDPARSFVEKVQREGAGTTCRCALQAGPLRDARRKIEAWIAERDPRSGGVGDAWTGTIMDGGQVSWIAWSPGADPSQGLILAVTETGYGAGTGTVIVACGRHFGRRDRSVTGTVTGPAEATGRESVAAGEPGGSGGDAEMRAIGRILEVVTLDCPPWVEKVGSKVQADRRECGVVEDRELAKERLERWVEWKTVRGTGAFVGEWHEEEQADIHFALRRWATAGHEYVLLLLWAAGQEERAFTVTWRVASSTGNGRRGENTLPVLPPS